MPLNFYEIKPNNVSQTSISLLKEPNELECVANFTLANLIRQLGSLGQHATSMFESLTKDAIQINIRSQNLNQRIEKLKTKLAQTTVDSETVSLDDVQSKKQFKSSNRIDQNILSRETMPDAMKALYEKAEPPPDLFEFNSYRNDGVDPIKTFSDPGFFYKIWSNELIKRNEIRKKKKRSKSQNKIFSNESQPKSNLIEAISKSDLEVDKFPVPPPQNDAINNIKDQNEEEQDFPRPPTELLKEMNLKTDEENYYVNYNDQQSYEDQENRYVNATELNEPPQSYYVNYRLNEDNQSSNTEETPNSITKSNRISTFVDNNNEKKSLPAINDNKTKLNQAISLGMFNLKKPIIEKTQTELQGDNFLANNPNVSDILNIARSLSNNEEESDDENW